MADWNTDAQFADVIDERFLGTNSQIDAFLSAGPTGKFLIIASKGMGKTLLLRHKRKQIEDGHKDYFLIPRNSTADYVTLPNSPTKGLIALMETHHFWQDLWTIAIATAALLNFPHKVSAEEGTAIRQEIERADLPTELERELTSAFSGQYHFQRAPSTIIDMLLQADTKAVARARASGQQVIMDLFNKHISSGCGIFIDSFDQALNSAFPENQKIWCNGQTGLLKAAWELSRHNRHVKVFVTIRQEAYSYFNDPEKTNMRGSSLLIEYSDEDLRRIFEKAVRHYESLETIEEFLGIKHIYNGYLRVKEDAFQYIVRHTIGVPRWLMVIGEAISNARHGRGRISEAKLSKLQQKSISVALEKKSAELCHDYLVDEMASFYRGGTADDYIEGLVSKIGSTVLSISTLRRIAERLIASGWTGTDHPFCLLYNLGLLGEVKRGSNGTKQIQRFRRPYQFNWVYKNILPNRTTHYLVHPALHSLIQNKNGAFRFNKVRIGDGLPWSDKEDNQVRNETIRIFISYSHADSEAVTEIADMIDEHLNSRSVLHDIWFDKWKMRAGKWIQDQLEEGLRTSDYLILVVSPSSLASNAVAVEWKTTFREKLTANDDRVLPFLLADVRHEQLPTFLKDIYAYTHDGKRETIVRLVEDILHWHTKKATDSVSKREKLKA